MRWFLVASLLAVGCRQVFGIGYPELGGDATIADSAAADAEHDAPSTGCFGSPYQICVSQVPQSPFTFGTDINFDTDSGLCQEFTSPQGITGCLIAGSSVALTGGTVRVTGTRPLIVLSTSSMTMSASAALDVASHTGVGRGPGADPASCSSGTAPTTGGGTSGGGAGGSFGGRGGSGGNGAVGGSGGNSGAAVAMPGLRGGCAGQTGGGAGGAAGDGGGAILLVAVTTIQLDGTLDASGGGAGGGAASTGGGGGGGSGGMVVFEAEMVAVGSTGKLFASGGGGGEGSGTGANGNPGGEATGPTASAAGGSGANPNSGDGGDGTAGNVLGGKSGGNGQSTANGGGGGGGAGFVLVHATTQSIAAINVAPPVTVLQ